MKARRKDRPQILLDLWAYVPELGGVLEPIVELAKDHQWRFINLRHTRDVLPEATRLNGAITNALPDSPHGTRLLEMNCPSVRIGVAIHPKDHLVPAILPDLPSMGKLAAEHFHARSFMHVGYIRNTPWAKSKAMHEHFGSRAEELGMNCHSLQIQRPPSGTTEGHQNRTYGDKQTVDWLRTIPKPIGIFCYSDALAGRVCFMCESLGLAVPEDVALIGNGNTIDSRVSPVQLSSIVPNHQKTAELAVKLLEDMMTGKPVPPRTFVASMGIAERHSTNVLAVADPMVGKAIRYLWDNLEFPITVEDVVRDLDVSRSTLERAFRTNLDRGINAELQRKRLERLGEMLLSTDLTIAESAKAVGFNNLAHVHKLFRKRFGVTPRTFRQQNG